jgi:hypothetical protein
MKSLTPFALLSAFSFVLLVAQWNPPSDALACGGYGVFSTKLTQTDVDLAVSLLEKQVPDRLTELGTPTAERRMFSRAALRPRTRSSVVVLSYQTPRVGDLVLRVTKTVHGQLTIAAPGASRLKVAYRVNLAKKQVELQQGETWVAAAKWTRAPQTIAMTQPMTTDATKQQR